MDQLTSSTAQAFHVVVIHPFGVYARGAIVSDAADIADILAGENARHVNKIAAQ